MPVTGRYRAAGVLVAVPAAVVGLSWPALAYAVVITVIVIAAVLWTLAKPPRSKNLAMPINACRGSQPPGWPLPEAAPRLAPTSAVNDFAGTVMAR